MKIKGSQEKKEFKIFKIVVETYEEAVAILCRANLSNGLIKEHIPHYISDGEKCIDKIPTDKLYSIIADELEKQGYIIDR